MISFLKLELKIKNCFVCLLGARAYVSGEQLIFSLVHRNPVFSLQQVRILKFRASESRESCVIRRSNPHWDAIQIVDETFIKTVMIWRVSLFDIFYLTTQNILFFFLFLKNKKIIDSTFFRQFFEVKNDIVDHYIRFEKCRLILVIYCQGTMKFLLRKNHKLYDGVHDINKHFFI